MDNKSKFAVTKGRLRLVLAMAVALAVVAPAAVFASHQFTDVPDTNIFHANIGWMADNNITAGCNPPANDQYCPSQNVTREQMAAFMQRLAENKVVDAADSVLLAGQAPAQYQTVVAGVSCDGVSCVDAASLTTTPLLELTINVPAAGYIALNGSFDVSLINPTNEYVAGWMTLDGDTSSLNGCEGSFLGVPLGANRILGAATLNFLENPIAHAVSSVSPVVAVSAGTHTIRLCDFTTAASSTYSASLSAVWSASGSATTSSATAAMDISDVSPELVATLEAITSK